MANASGWKRAVLAPVFLGCLASAMMVPGSALVGDPAAAQSSPAVGSPPPARQAPALLPDDQFDRLDVTKFARPTLINNKFLPMKPGTRYIYDGTTVEDDGKVVPHRIVLNITDLVKVIAGVKTLVSYDLDYSDGELVEAELAFFAQDDAGNVWHFGQYPEEYEDRKFLKAPTWIPGIQNARAGIMMKAEPVLGTPSYAQGYGPAVNWTDRGQIHQVGQEVVVGGTRYTDVLVIKETSGEEIDAAQLKYYAPGVGNIKVGWMGAGEKTKETLELTKVEQMDATEMAAVRAKALALEKSGYRRSRNVYAKTAPAVRGDAAR